MKKLVLIVALAPVLLSGCGAFGAAFTREMSAQLADDIGGVVDKKLGDDFKGMGDLVAGGIKSIPIPAPIKPDPLGDSLGVLAALFVANTVRGGIRKWQGKGDEKG